MVRLSFYSSTELYFFTTSGPSRARLSIHRNPRGCGLRLMNRVGVRDREWGRGPHLQRSPSRVPCSWRSSFFSTPRGCLSGCYWEPLRSTKTDLKCDRTWNCGRWGEIFWCDKFHRREVRFWLCGRVAVHLRLSCFSRRSIFWVTSLIFWVLRGGIGVVRRSARGYLWFWSSGEWGGFILICGSWMLRVFWWESKIYNSQLLY